MQVRNILLILCLLSLTTVNAQKFYFVGIQGKLEDIERGEKPLLNGTNIAIDAILALFVKNADVNTYTYEKYGDFENIRKSIDSISISKDDIIMLYYTGHGGRNPYDESQCPQLLYDGVACHALSADSLTQYFLDKGARFYMFIYDTSNTLENTLAQKHTVAFHYKPNNSNCYFSPYRGGKKDYRTLNKLFSQKGYVIINAASIGTNAYTTQGKSILAEAISNAFVKPEQQWSALVVQIKDMVKKMSNGEQSPSFIIDVE